MPDSLSLLFGKASVTISRMLIQSGVSSELC